MFKTGAENTVMRGGPLCRSCIEEKEAEKERMSRMFKMLGELQSLLAG